MTPDQIVAIKEAAEEALLKIPGVTGVAIGQKEKNGALTGEISILVLVEKKKPAAGIPAAEVIPPEINGIKTDVIETGIIRSHATKGGTQLQSEKSSGSGTLGCFAFTNGATPRAVLVTNQHVVMDGTATDPKGFEVGPVICSCCSPCCSKVLGHVNDIKLNPDLDGATAFLKAGTQILPEVDNVVVSGRHDVTLAEANSNSFAVKIFSRMHDRWVNGVVKSINATGDEMDHENNLHRHYQNQILINSTDMFGDFGDSGSVVFDSSNQVVGLFFGGNDPGTVALACPIAQVESQFNVHLFTGTAPGQVYTVPADPSHTTAGDSMEVAPLAAGTGFSPRLQKLNEAYRKIRSTEKGRMYDQLFHQHMNEVRYLVNHNKRVATVWHRNQGPGFLVHFSNSVMDENYQLPQQVKSVPLTGLLTRMAAILTQYGSEALKADIAQHLEEILSYALDCNTTDQLITRFINQEEKCLTPQEP